MESKLATELTGPDLEMKEQFKLLHGKEAPYSYIKGKLPIMGCFATNGVEIKDYFISDHHKYGSVGDPQDARNRLLLAISHWRQPTKSNKEVTTKTPVEDPSNEQKIHKGPR